MNDRELCEMFGTTLDDVEREVGKVESGDYSSWDFSQAMMGSPMTNERMGMISASVGESRIAAMKRVTEEQGISRAEFVRRAIDHELMVIAWPSRDQAEREEKVGMAEYELPNGYVLADEEIEHRAAAWENGTWGGGLVTLRAGRPRLSEF